MNMQELEDSRPVVVAITLDHGNLNLLYSCYFIIMKSSKSLRKDSQSGPESDCDLPKQWDYLSKRLSEVERALAVLEKRQYKIEKKLTSNISENNQLNTEITEQLLGLKTNMLVKSEVKEIVNKQIQIIQSQLRTVCSEETSKFLNHFKYSLQDKTEDLQLKIKAIQEQSKNYVDRAVFELKETVKKYMRQETGFEKKSDRPNRDPSPALPKSSLSKSKSANKFYESTSNRSEIDNGLSNTSKSREDLSKEPGRQGNSSSRVSYLREKLKQFEKINKKYDADNSEKTSKRQDKDDMMKKMRNYRQYLEQSESELEPSNILTYEDVSSYTSGKKNFPPF